MPAGSGRSVPQSRIATLEYGFEDGPSGTATACPPSPCAPTSTAASLRPATCWKPAARRRIRAAAPLRGDDSADAATAQLPAHADGADDCAAALAACASAPPVDPADVPELGAGSDFLEGYLRPEQLPRSDLFLPDAPKAQPPGSQVHARAAVRAAGARLLHARRRVRPPDQWLLSLGPFVPGMGGGSGAGPGCARAPGGAASAWLHLWGKPRALRRALAVGRGGRPSGGRGHGGGIGQLRDVPPAGRIGPRRMPPPVRRRSKRWLRSEPRVLPAPCPRPGAATS